MGSKHNNKTGYLFTVEILLEELSNGLALEKLLQTLNRAEAIKDYKVVTGIDLGKLIELNQMQGTASESLQNAVPSDTARSINIKPSSTKSPPMKSSGKLTESKNKSDNASYTKAWIDQIAILKNNNSLVRIFVVQSKGLRFDIPCRILHYSSEEESLTVYHVDEKKVFTYNFNEIEDITTA